MDQPLEINRNLLPLRDAIDVISGKWKLPIILTLVQNGKRYKDLNNTITGISSKVLSRELQNLEENFLIEKKNVNCGHQIVQYSLTDHGRSLVPLIDEILKWGQKHRNVIVMN